jgi:hypothetical protein
MKEETHELEDNESLMKKISKRNYINELNRLAKIHYS